MAQKFQINLFILSALLCFASCTKSNPEGKENKTTTAVQEDFAKIRITDNDQHLLFTFLQADGTFQTVEKINDVPENARSQVIVVDTRLSPEKRRASKVLYVADLTDKKEDGSYPYSLVSRYKFERDVLREPMAHSDVLPVECASLTKSPTDRVILYSTSWCGVCKACAAYLTKESIRFEERDIEKNPDFQKELQCKALKSKQRLNGVPVLDIGGTLLLGFDRDRVDELVKKLDPAPTKRSATH